MKRSKEEKQARLMGVLPPGFGTWWKHIITMPTSGKRFKGYITRSGARWNRAAAENLLPVRMANMSKRFDERWRLAYNLLLN